MKTMADELKKEEVQGAPAEKTFVVTQKQLDEHSKQLRQQITNEVLTSMQTQVTLINVRIQAMDLAIKSSGKGTLAEKADEIYAWLINQPKTE